MIMLRLESLVLSASISLGTLSLASSSLVVVLVVVVGLKDLSPHFLLPLVDVRVKFIPVLSD